MLGARPRVALWFAAVAFLLPQVLLCQDNKPKNSDIPDKDKTRQGVEKPKSESSQQHVVVLSGIAKTARIADPNERVVFSGRVMRMADYVAAVSSSSEAAQRLHIPEKHNPEKDQPTPPSKPTS